MQTRRRLHQQANQEGLAENENHNKYLNPLFTELRDSSIQNHTEAAPVTNIKESVPPTDFDDKYNKAGRTWNLRSLSAQLPTTSVFRTYIQEPLSAAAAVVTGDYTEAAYEPYTNFSKVEPDPNGPLKVINDQESSELANFIETVEDIYVMAARDRTSEFSSAIRALQARDINRAVNIRDPRKVKAIQSHSEFMAVAKFVGKNIASTYAKLEKLTLLAKKKGLFDDRPEEIQELTYIIKSDLNALNQQIARLQDISKDQRRENTGKHLNSHSSNMVLALQSKLANMSTDFKQILEVRTENLKEQKARREQYGESYPPMSTIPSAAAMQSSLLLREQNPAIAIDMNDIDDSAPLLASPERIQTQQQMAVYHDSDTYVHQRAETMQNIESTIVELGGIFQQLAHMVKEQEEIVERIDTNIVDAELNIESAHGEILRYFQSVSKNRWLMIKIFAILILFFFFFVIFLT